MIRVRFGVRFRVRVRVRPFSRSREVRFWTRPPGVMLNYAGEYCEYGEYCDACDA